MVISISLKIGMVKFLKNLHIFLIVQKQMLIVQKQILNDNIRHFIIWVKIFAAKAESNH